jgi:hypothetical protein
MTTKFQLNYYKHIERIAIALEKIAAQPVQARTQRMQQATHLLYGNDSQGRSHSNYEWPTRPVTGSSVNSFQPCIESPLDARIYQESQAVTGGEFHVWYSALSSDEKDAYRRVYGH